MRKDDSLDIDAVVARWDGSADLAESGVGYLLYGLIEASVTAFAGSTYTQIAAFAVVILALAVMPNGLLGRAATKKV